MSDATPGEAGETTDEKAANMLADEASAETAPKA